MVAGKVSWDIYWWRKTGFLVVVGALLECTHKTIINSIVNHGTSINRQGMGEANNFRGISIQNLAI